MKRALFVGDINVDVIMGGLASLPVVDKEILCESYQEVMGSSAVIAACAYACLGGQVAFAGLAGKDRFGDFMVEGLKGFGIDTSRVQRTSEVNTGVTVNLIYGTTRTQVTYAGTIEAFDGATLDERTLEGIEHVHFAGPYQQSRLRPHITRLLDIARDRGITTSLDPQWDATERWEYMDQWMQRLTFLLINDAEAMSLTKTGSPQDACKQLAQRTRCAVVKAGPRGAMAMDNGKLVHVPARRVAVQDTTGAGDSFDAGFLYATLVRKMPLREALEFGAAVGSRSCAFVGGTSARSTYQDIVEFMKTTAPLEM